MLHQVHEVAVDGSLMTSEFRYRTHETLLAGRINHCRPLISAPKKTGQSLQKDSTPEQGSGAFRRKLLS